MRTNFFGAAAAMMVFVCLTSGSVAASGLTFADRTEAQEAIERVYYSHQIGATKRFEDAVPRGVLEDKVRRYLAETELLKSRWGVKVTSRDLIDEWTRIRHETRLPDRLAEIERALRDDPVAILDCFVRPILVDRMVRAKFAADAEIHSPALASANTLRARLLESGDWSRSGHNPSVSEFIDSSGPVGHGEPSASPHSESPSDPARLFLAPDEYAASRRQAPAQVGEVGPVIEESEQFTTSILLGEEPGAFRVATYSIPKVRWDIWFRSQIPALSQSLIAPGPAQDETLEMALAPVELSKGAAAGDGNSATDDECVESWAATSLTNAPAARYYHTGVWTGNLFIVWGGYASAFMNTGGKYDPVTNSWTPTSTTGAPSVRRNHAAVWTGTLMIVWGGWNGSTALAGGGRYEPISDSWTPVSTTNQPTARYDLPAVWTGSEMIIWGGNTGCVDCAAVDGGRWMP